MAAGAEFAFFAEERRVVDGEEHTHGRFVDGNGWQRLRVFIIAEGIADFKVFQTDDGADVSRRNFGCSLASHTGKSMQFFDFGFLPTAVAVADGDVHALFQGAAMYASHSDTSGIVRIIQRGDEHLRCSF